MDCSLLTKRSRQPAGRCDAPPRGGVQPIGEILAEFLAARGLSAAIPPRRTGFQPVAPPRASPGLAFAATDGPPRDGLETCPTAG